MAQRSTSRKAAYPLSAAGTSRSGASTAYEGFSHSESQTDCHKARMSLSPVCQSGAG